MVLCIGERVHKPTLALCDVERFREKWTGPQRLRYILAMPAMTHGATRTRLVGQYGLQGHDLSVVNLLWPDCECGTWDVKEGEKSAEVVREWLSRNATFCDEWVEPRVSRRVSLVMLLGRRVASAFGYPDLSVDEGHHLEILGPGASAIAGIIVPHPSGRSRSMNDPHIADRIRTKIRELLENET